MNLFLLGATGRTGRAILQQAHARGHRVTAFVRSPGKLGSSRGSGSRTRSRARRQADDPARMRRALHLLLALSVHVVTAILGLGPGRIRRAFRRVDTAQAAPLPREVVPIAWAMCAMVAAAAVLMEVKPW